MRYDIVPIGKRYRGMARLLLGTELYTKRTRKIFDALLDRYFEYISIVTDEAPSKAGLEKIIDFYNELKKYEIPCEVIAWNLHPIETAFDYPVEFLGFDLVCDMAESLIEGCTDSTILQKLNENGLCDTPDIANALVPFLDHGGLKWEPCYIYKVIA